MIRQCIILEIEENGFKRMECHRDNALFAGAYYCSFRDEWTVDFPGSPVSYRIKGDENAKTKIRSAFYSGFEQAISA